jgi:hypothetical protein
MSPGFDSLSKSPGVAVCVQSHDTSGYKKAGMRMAGSASPLRAVRTSPSPPPAAAAAAAAAAQATKHLQSIVAAKMARAEELAASKRRRADEIKRKRHEEEIERSKAVFRCGVYDRAQFLIVRVFLLRSFGEFQFL